MQDAVGYFMIPLKNLKKWRYYISGVGLLKRCKIRIPKILDRFDK